MRSRQYSEDVLAPPARRPVTPPQVAAENGLVVEDSAGDFCGAVVACEKDAVTLEDRRGKRRVFPLTGTFLLEGKRVTLVRPATGQGSRPGRTASGSVAAPVSRARVARASRIYVEGKHDAELVEKIWGDDLRDVGVVVEFLNGIDDLPAIVARVRAGCEPAPRRARRSPGRWLEGESHRRAGELTARPRGWSPVHRRLGCGEAVGPRHRPLAGRAARHAMEGRRARRDRLAAGYRRRRGGESWQVSGPTRTWSPPFSGGSRNSSTSSPRPASQ